MKQRYFGSAVIAGIALSCLTSASWAQVLDQRCRDRTVFLSEVEAVEKGLLHLEQSVESVPPAEAEYLQKESRAALEQNNPQRYSIVAGRRYYRALQFHNEIKVALDNLAAAKSSAKLNHSAIYLSVVVSRLGDVSAALSEYIEADSKRTPSVLTKDDRSSLYFSMPVVRSSALRILQCALGSL